MSKYTQEQWDEMSDRLNLEHQKTINAIHAAYRIELQKIEDKLDEILSVLEIS
jgi:hypothetical protein